jgi:hypothetical protein
MNFTFDVALGRVAMYAFNVQNNSPANSALLVVPLEHNGLESDNVLRQKATLADLLSGTTNEQTTANRKTIEEPNITVTVDNSLHQVTAKAADVTWSGANAAGPQVDCFVWCYVPDKTAGSINPTAIPLTKHDRLWIPDGQPFILSGPTGFFQGNAA